MLKRRSDAIYLTEMGAFIARRITERTLVSEVDGALHVKNIPEPTPPEPVTRPMELYINGELVSKWDE